MLLDLYTLCCIVALVQAVLMFLHVWEHSRFHASRLHSPFKSETPLSVTLFVPCKGLDNGLEQHLQALFEQDHPRYELCFVMETPAEPAVEIVGRLQLRYPQIPCRFVFSGAAVDCGQKVHNLIQATRTLDSTTEVLAFVDSDARPHRQWLSRLVDRLRSRKPCVSTGYRIYVPVDQALPNLLLAAINNMVAGLLGPHMFNLVWGGGWAIRVTTFQQLGLPEAWRGGLSDDLIVSRLVHRAGLRVAYDPHCLVTSPARTTLAGLAEFLRRQYLILRIYSPLWWQAAFWGGLVTNLTLLASIVLAAFWRATAGPWWIPAGCGLFLYTLGSCRAAIFAEAVRPFVAAERGNFDRVAWLNIWGWPLVTLVNWLGLLSASVGRRITWRGIRYRIDSSRQVEILSRGPLPQELTRSPLAPPGVMSPPHGLPNPDILAFPAPSSQPKTPEQHDSRAA